MEDIASRTTIHGMYSKEELTAIFLNCGLTPYEPASENASTDPLVRKIREHNASDRSLGSGSYCDALLNFLKSVINLPASYRAKGHPYSDA